MALSFISYHDFVRLEFTVPVGSHCGGVFLRDSERFDWHALMYWGAYEVHSGYGHSGSFHAMILSTWGLLYPSEPTVGESFTPTRMDLKLMPKCAIAPMLSLGVFGTQFHFVAVFRPHGVSCCHRNSLRRTLSHRLRQIQKECRNELWCV